MPQEAKILGAVRLRQRIKPTPTAGDSPPLVSALAFAFAFVIVLANGLESFSRFSLRGSPEIMDPRL